MLSKSYFSKAKKKKLAKTNLAFIFSEHLKKKENETFSKEREKVSPEGPGCGSSSG